MQKDRFGAKPLQQRDSFNFRPSKGPESSELRNLIESHGGDVPAFFRDAIQAYKERHVAVVAAQADESLKLDLGSDWLLLRDYHQLLLEDYEDHDFGRHLRTWENLNLITSDLQKFLDRHAHLEDLVTRFGDEGKRTHVVFVDVENRSDRLETQFLESRDMPLPGEDATRLAERIGLRIWNIFPREELARLTRMGRVGFHRMVLPVGTPFFSLSNGTTEIIANPHLSPVKGALVRTVRGTGTVDIFRYLQSAVPFTEPYKSHTVGFWDWIGPVVDRQWGIEPNHRVDPPGDRLPSTGWLSRLFKIG